MDIVFLILVLCLLGFGLVMVASSSYVAALHKYGDSYHYISRQLIFAVVGLVVMLLVTVFDYHQLRRFSLALLIVSVILLVLVLIPGIGIKVNGARRWLGFGSFRFQPSEIAKLAIILVFASYMAANYKRMKEFKVGILLPAAVLLLVCGLVAVETHVSGAILIFCVGAVLIFVGGASLKWFLGIGATGVVALAGFAILTPYAKGRITTWLNPFADPTGDGFQTIQSLYAIGSGGLLGLGLGQSRQKYLYIPEPQNDYIFSIVCEELGFIGAMMVIVLFVLLIWRGFVIAYHARDKFGSLLVVGIISRVAVQAILNIAVVTNSIPPTGISLPFFSYGGTALLMLLFEMGIVLAVSRYSRLETNE
ncbi:MAG: putative lipid II flippase FtsW [Clostridia bacterium]|nr:putative lipid II flippase FtsW [Clostridia bacterium]